jgi:threonine dehydrogenase-like Zn-dependent dehydrogenase
VSNAIHEGVRTVNALAIYPGKGSLHTTERPEPGISEPDQVKLQVLQVGICGTDREEVSGGRAQAPDGQDELTIGHEMLGRVVDVGQEVSRVSKGDLAIFTVRRGCGHCLPCRMNRPDMCQTGDYLERGIKGLDGYQAEFIVDKEQYLVSVPEELEHVAVLTEPLTITEKAIDESVRLQNARLPDAPAHPDWLFGRRCMVAGIGAVGLLAALALRLRGALVYGLDIVDRESPRPRWLEAIGGTYIDGRKVAPDKVDSKVGAMDLIFEATGVAKLEFNLLDALCANGIYVLTGIPGGDRPLEVPGAQLIRQLVLGNQVMLGSVNASRDHFQMAVDDLRRAEARWPGHTRKLITASYPWKSFQDAFSKHESDSIKTVIKWAQ